MRKIELLFYRTEPSKDNTGLKQVLFKVTETIIGYSPDPEETQVPVTTEETYDFGYANWTGTEWEFPDVPEGMSIEVHSWANNPDPKHLINESKLIKI